MSARTKLPGGKKALAELTRLKYYWRDELGESQKDFWRSRFHSTDSQAVVREEMRVKLRIELKYDKQLTHFRAWDEEQLALEEEAQRQADEESKLKQEHPDWDAERLRSEVISGSYRRSLAQGDWKLGLSAVDRHLNVEKVELDRDKFLVDADIYFERLLQKAGELNASTLSNAEKIAAMRAEAFKSVDELQASGKIKIPQSMKRVRRPYQNVALVAVREVRQIALYWARRCRKSTTLGDIAFDEISKESGRMVIAASASLLLGKELVGVTLSAAEQAMIVANEAAAVRSVFETGAAEQSLEFKVADSNKDKILTGLTPEDFAELYQSSRMELRLYFDKTHFSRVQVIAPNPATARSWRATVLRDEAGFTNANFENELRIATDPMMRDTPDLKIIYASNLSGNDRHPYFEMTMPREITAASEDEQFPANPDGHLYIGQQGILVHRVALKDAYAAGHALFDDHGEKMSYAQCQKFPQFKSGWDETYALNHKSGGAAAIDIVALLSAQRRGVGKCHFSFIENEGEFREALSLLRAMLTHGPVGIGFDTASTTEEKSNPSSITVTENVGGERFQRAVIVFKSNKRVVMSDYLERIVQVIRERPRGGPARRLCIDASNERLAAAETRDDLVRFIPVELILGGASVDPLPSGYKDPINYKTLLGDLYSAAVNDGRTVLPPADYLKADHRLPIKDAGQYLCEVDSDGKHGDTFDSGKLAEYALASNSGGAINTETLARIKTGPVRPIKFRKFTPRRLVA